VEFKAICSVASGGTAVILDRPPRGALCQINVTVPAQWNFNPAGSIMQIEDHEVNLYGVWMLHLIVRPEIKRVPAVATIASWRLA
jgi:hypothetical protein